MSEPITPPQVELAAAEAQADATPTPPCDVYTLDGRVFHVPDVDAWQWHEQGLFATGNWPGEREEDVLVPSHQIKYVRFDFDALQNWLAANTDE